MNHELNHLPIGVFFMNDKAQITYANIKYKEILSNPDTSFTPQWTNMIHEDDKEKVLKIWHASAVQTKPAHFLCKLVKSNKNIIWADIRIAPNYDHRQNLIGFSGTLMDITNQVMLEKVLERFKKAVENTDSQIIFTDSQGIITFANSALKNTTGFDIEEVIGTKAGKLWGGLMDKSFYKELWDTILIKKQPFSGEVINKKKNGQTYYAHISITPILDELGNVEFFVGIERDISYIKEMDKVKNEFISLASHQLRTPLSSIKWLCELFWQMEKEKLSQDQIDIMEKIQNENERLIKLVNSLLMVSRVDSKKIVFSPSLENINEITKKVVQKFEPKIKEKNQTLITDFDSNIPKLSIDIKLAEEAISNVVSNAYKYTPKGGKIYIKTELAQNLNGKSAIVLVKDTGIGIPQEEKHRIFEKFFRAKNAQLNQTDGNGLGLYFVKWVMDQHGGKIWFESTEGRGSTFYLQFPL